MATSATFTTLRAAGQVMSATGQAPVNYSYDNDSRFVQIAQGASTVGFAYDSNGRRTMLTLPNGVTMSYSYDTASQLTGINYTLGATLLGNLAYSYDLAGRRALVGGSFARTGMPNALTSASYNVNNQLTQFGPSSLSYDANGNLTSDGANTYTWNARNQLVSISGSASANFQYDAFGRRTNKMVGAMSTGYLYDGVNPVEEFSGGAGSAAMLAGGVDEYFQRTDSSGTFDFLTDALGSTVALAGPAGALGAQYTYEPFGNTPAIVTSTNRYQFTGEENDGTGLYFYHKRYYSPIRQTFVSEDPIEFAGGFDLYGYVDQDPVNRIDPLGLCWFYSQSTGEMYNITLSGDPYSMASKFVIVYAGAGYSGRGQGLNNPADQFIPNVGPLPQGWYTIGRQQTNFTSSGKALYQSMRLIPNPSNEMFGRGGFLMHGDNSAHNHSASEGCIVLPLDVRNIIGKSKDHCLTVVP